MEFVTGFDKNISDLLIVTVVAFNKSCGSFNLVLGELVLDLQKTVDLSGHQIFANPEFQSKRKRRAMPCGAGYTEYQPEIIFLDPFAVKAKCMGKPRHPRSPKIIYR